MAGQDTTVVYKAIANFTALNSSIDKTKRKIQELRAEEAKANASSLAEADFLAAAREGQSKQLDGYAKKLRNYKSLLDSVNKAESQIGQGKASSTKAQSDAIDKLNTRLEKMQKLLRESGSPGPPSANKSFVGTSDSAQINRIAKAVEAHAAANAAYAASAPAANTLRRSEATGYDKLAVSLTKYTAARLAANAADKGAVGAPFPSGATGGSDSRFGPGAMPPRRERASTTSSTSTSSRGNEGARFVAGLDPQTGDLDSIIDKAGKSLVRFQNIASKQVANPFDALRAGARSASTELSRAERLLSGGGSSGGGGNGPTKTFRFFEDGAEGAARSAGKFERAVDGLFRRMDRGGSTFSRFLRNIRGTEIGVEAAGSGISKAFDKIYNGLTQKFEFFGTGIRLPLLLIIPLVTAIGAAINPLIAVLGAAGTAVFGLGANFLSLSGTLLAIPGILGAVVSAVGAVKLAFGGITGAQGVFALASKAKQSKTAATKATDDGTGLEPLTAAQMKLLNSPDMVAEGLKQADAQLKLNKARKDGKVILDGLVFSQKQLNMLQAQANLQSAKENLANVLADPNSTKGDKLQAESAYLQAQQALKGNKKKSSAATTADTDAKAYEDALAKLPPSAQAFVKAIQALQPALAALRKGVQTAFFDQLVPVLTKLNPLVMQLGNLLIPVAAAVGKFAAKLVTMLDTSEWSGDISKLGTLFGQILTIMGDGLLYLLKAVKDLILGSKDFTLDILGRIRDGAKSLSDIIAQARADGSLAAWLKTVGDRLSVWYDIVTNLAKILFNYGKAAGLFGDDLAQSFDDITKGWLKNSEKALEPGSKFHQYLKDIRPLLKEINGLLGDFFGGLKKIAGEGDPTNTKANALPFAINQKKPGQTPLANKQPGAIDRGTELVKSVRDFGKNGLGPLLDTLGKSDVASKFIDVLTQLAKAIDELYKAGVLDLIAQLLGLIVDLLKAFNDFAKTDFGSAFLKFAVGAAAVLLVVGALGKLLKVLRLLLRVPLIKIPLNFLDKKNVIKDGAVRDATQTLLSKTNKKTGIKEPFYNRSKADAKDAADARMQRRATGKDGSLNYEQKNGSGEYELRPVRKTPFERIKYPLKDRLGEDLDVAKGAARDTFSSGYGKVRNGATAAARAADDAAVRAGRAGRTGASRVRDGFRNAGERAADAGRSGAGRTRDFFRNAGRGAAAGAEDAAPRSAAKGLGAALDDAAKANKAGGEAAAKATKGFWSSFQDKFKNLKKTTPVTNLDDVTSGLVNKTGAALRGAPKSTNPLSDAADKLKGAPKNPLADAVDKLKGAPKNPLQEVVDNAKPVGPRGDYLYPLNPQTKGTQDLLTQGGKYPEALDVPLAPGSKLDTPTAKPSFFNRLKNRLGKLKGDDAGYIKLGTDDGQLFPTFRKGADKLLGRGNTAPTSSRPTFDASGRPVYDISDTGPAPRGPLRPGKAPAVDYGNVFDISDTGVQAASKGSKVGRAAKAVGGIALDPIGSLIAGIGKTGLGKAVAGSGAGKVLGAVAKPLSKFLGPLGAVLGIVDTASQIGEAANSKGDKDLLGYAKKGQIGNLAIRAATDVGGGAIRGGINGAGVGTAILPGFGTLIGGGVGAVVGGAADAVKAIGPANLGKAAGLIGKNPRLLGDTAKKLNNGLIDDAFKGTAFGDFLDPAKKALKGIQGTLIDSVNNFLNGTKKGKGGKQTWVGLLHLFDPASIVQYVIDFPKVFGRVVTFLGNARDALFNAFNVLVNGGKIGKTKWVGLLHIFDPSAWADVGGVIGGVMTAITSYIQSQFGQLGDFFKNIGDFVSSTWENITGGGKAKQNQAAAKKADPNYKPKTGYTPGSYARGGFVRSLGAMANDRYARGRDTVRAMLEPGEFIVRKKAVDAVGRQQLEALNAGNAAVKYFAAGGLVGMPSMAMPNNSILPAMQPNTASPMVNDRSIAIHGLVINNPVPERGTQSVARKLRSLAYYGTS